MMVALIGEATMSVEIQKLLDIVKESGLKAEEMAAFFKVQAGSCQVYIAKTKKVSRVDYSGFDFQHPSIIRLSDKEAKELKLGRVRAQLDFSKSEDKVLEGFRTSLALMKHMAGEPVRGGQAKQIKAMKAHLVERQPRGNRTGGRRNAEDAQA
jgi:hypothetical protein